MFLCHFLLIVFSGNIEPLDTQPCSDDVGPPLSAFSRMTAARRAARRELSQGSGISLPLSFFHHCITYEERKRNRDSSRRVALFAVCIRAHFLRYLSNNREVSNFQLFSLADFADSRYFGFMPQVRELFRLVRDAIFSSPDPVCGFALVLTRRRTLSLLGRYCREPSCFC